jgi:hypothetical protein
MEDAIDPSVVLASGEGLPDGFHTHASCMEHASEPDGVPPFVALLDDFLSERLVLAWYVRFADSSRPRAAGVHGRDVALRFRGRQAITSGCTALRIAPRPGVTLDPCDPDAFRPDPILDELTSRDAPDGLRIRSWRGTFDRDVTLADFRGPQDSSLGSAYAGECEVCEDDVCENDGTVPDAIPG